MSNLFDQELSAYRYDLPEERIAKQPRVPRDDSRLLVYHRETDTIEHRRFKDLSQYLGDQHVLVANNSKVFKARLLGRRLTGGKIEFFLLEKKDSNLWEGLFRSSAQAREGLEFEIGEGEKKLSGMIVRGVRDSDEGTVLARLSGDPVALDLGEVPLPPYIDRKTELNDESQYQTTYAKHLGSSAAPTAGLHFTPELIQTLMAQGVSWEEVTLHVGLGTFRPVKVQNLSDHPMHDERFEITDETAARLNQARSQGKKIVAIGTTSVRTLESAYGEEKIRPGVGRTRLFIRPQTHTEGRSGFGESVSSLKVVDHLITNFHLPESTLLMLVSAFVGREKILEIYKEAIAQKYRFYSYGDAMLIL